MERVATLRKDPSVALARLLSYMALAVCVAAFALTLAEGAARPPAASAGAELDQLETSGTRLASELRRVNAGASPAAARRALRAAAADAAAISAELKRAEAAGLPADPRLETAVAAQWRQVGAARAALAGGPQRD
jgi:hypothetical protein